MAQSTSRKLRRGHLDNVPNSTKIAKCSMENATVYRTNKYGRKLTDAERTERKMKLAQDRTDAL